MGLSNMLSKLFKKENAGNSVKIPAKFKDFDSIIIPPEPKTRGIFIYKTLNLGLEFSSIPAAQNQSSDDEFSEIQEEVVHTEDIVEEITEED